MDDRDWLAERFEAHRPPGLRAPRVVTAHGQPRIALAFTIAGGRILELEVISDPGRLAGLDLVVVDG